MEGGGWGEVGARLGGRGALEGGLVGNRGALEGVVGGSSQLAPTRRSLCVTTVEAPCTHTSPHTCNTCTEKILKSNLSTKLNKTLK